jgi:hypothetical protein
MRLISVYGDYQSLLTLISHVTLCEDEQDRNIWRWNSLRKFTVQSFYLWLDIGGVISKDFDIIWYFKIPLKI